MAELIAKPPCAGLLPLTIGAMTLTGVAPERITSVAPFNGQSRAVSAGLKKALGMALPDPGRATGREGARVVWMGRGQVFVLGPEAPVALGDHAALADQSDAWAVMRLEGAGAEDVLSRLCPLDFRPPVFRRGHTARTELRHMMASVTKTGAGRFDIMVMRSFARTAVHDLETAMRSVAARSAPRSAPR